MDVEGGEWEGEPRQVAFLHPPSPLSLSLSLYFSLTHSHIHTFSIGSMD